MTRARMFAARIARRMVCGLALAVLILGVLGSANASPGPQPDIPATALLSELMGDELQEGVLDFYYWEEGDKTYRWYNGLFKPGYVTPWPDPAVLHGSGGELRIHVARSAPPDAGVTLEAWPRVKPSNGVPQGKKIRWECHIDTPPPIGSCHFEPSVVDGKLGWDIVAQLPAQAKNLYIMFQPAWFNNEDLEPTNLQEARWLFRARVARAGSE